MKLFKGFINWLNYFLPLLIFGVLYGLFDFNGLFGQDAHLYHHYGQIFRDSLGQLTLVGDITKPVGVAYPFYGALFSLGVGLPLALQLLSLGGLLLAIFFFQRILGLLYPENKQRIALYAFICLLVSPYVLRLSYLVKTDLFCLAMVLGGFYYALRYWRDLKGMDLGLSVLFIVTAFLGRYVAAILLIIPVLYSVYQCLKNQKWGHLLIGLGGIALAALPHYWVYGNNILGFMNVGYGPTWDLAHFFQSSFSEDIGQVKYDHINLIFILKNIWHPAYFLLGPLLLLFIRQVDYKPKESKLILGMLVLYAFYLGGISFQNLRYLSLSFPFILIFCFPAFGRLLDYTKKVAWAKYLLIPLVLIQLALFTYLIRQNIGAMQKEQKLVTRINEISQGATVYNVGLEGPLWSYGEQAVISLWDQEITSFEKDAYLVDHPLLLERLLKTDVLENNYALLKEQYDLEKLEELPTGWIIYQIKSR